MIGMDLSKSLEFFDPINDFKGAVHVIGVGAMGSRIAELLVRLGIQSIHIWDFDKVESKNVTNQIYFDTQKGQEKVLALTYILQQINPTLMVHCHPEGWQGEVVSGYVFLCVDSIELRHKIATKFKDSASVKGMFDTRMRLEDAQSYGADWTNAKQKQTFINSMDFTDTDAVEATPVSACGTTLSVASTVVSTAAFTVANFLNLIRKGKCDTMIFVDAFAFTLNKF